MHPGSDPPPFRFGLQVARASTRAELAEAARRAEDLGFDILQVPDHLLDTLPPLLPLVTAADATTTLRVGTLVLNNDLRHPAVLAREAAAVDLLSDGRFELGIGAGHAEPEYRSIGLPFDRPPVRVERLVEALAVLDRLLRGDEVTHAGRHYRFEGHRSHPPPVQRPRPPILVGTGNRTLLAAAAPVADVIGLTGSGRTNPDGQTHEPTGFPPAQVEERITIVRQASGDRGPAAPQLHVLVQAVIETSDRAGSAERLARAFPPLTPEDVLGSPFVLLGTVEEMARDLRDRRERFGIAYLTVRAEAREAIAPVVAGLAGT